MIVEFDSSFKKGISKIKDESLKAKVAEIIFKLEDAKSLKEINNLKKMKGY